MQNVTRATATFTIGIAAAFALSSPALAKTPPAKAAAIGWDEKGASELKVILEKFMAAWDVFDLPNVKAPIGDKLWVIWDYDMDMKPIGWTGRAEMDKFFDDSVALMKKVGITWTWKTTMIDCKVSGLLGVCIMEGDATTTMPKMPPLVVPMRGTEVFTKQNGVWKYVHHHGSAARDVMPGRFLAANAKATTGWADAGSDMPGIKLLPIWMNPGNMYSAAIMKATQTVKQPRHVHPHPFTFAVLEGSVTTSDASGKDVNYGPGSVVYRAANEPHQTTINAGAVVFAVTTGPLTNVPVDEKGGPSRSGSN